MTFKKLIKLLPINPDPPVTTIFFILIYKNSTIKYSKLIKELSFVL